MIAKEFIEDIKESFSKSEVILEALVKTIDRINDIVVSNTESGGPILLPDTRRDYADITHLSNLAKTHSEHIQILMGVQTTMLNNFRILLETSYPMDGPMLDAKIVVYDCDLERQNQIVEMLTKVGVNMTSMGLVCGNRRYIIAADQHERDIIYAMIAEDVVRTP
jgi:hypothetical protein